MRRAGPAGEAPDAADQLGPEARRLPRRKTAPQQDCEHDSLNEVDCDLKDEESENRGRDEEQDEDGAEAAQVGVGGTYAGEQHLALETGESAAIEGHGPSAQDKNADQNDGRP